MALPPRILDIDVLTKEMDQTMTDRLRMKHTGADGQVLFFSHAWRRLFWIRRPLVREILLEFFSTCRVPLRRVCHRLIAFSIAGRGQAPEKVTTTDLFYLRSMDMGTTVNVPYLLAQYLFRFASGRKQGARMFGGHFVACLGLVKLRICDKLGDVVTWVAMGLERQHVGAATRVAPVDPEVA
ncbi:hypothetical protein Tco_1311921 [Tanacetum coccineum]